MRRAADRLLRTAKRSSLGRLNTIRVTAINANRPQKHIGLRSVSSLGKNHGSSQTFQSSMYLRQFSAAAIVSIVASGLWYYQKVPDQSREVSDSTTATRVVSYSTPSVSGQSSVQNEPQLTH